MPTAGLFSADVLNVVTALATGAFGFALIIFLVEKECVFSPRRGPHLVRRQPCPSFPAIVLPSETHLTAPPARIPTPQNSSVHPETGNKPFDTFSETCFWALMASTLKPDIPTVPITHLGKFLAFVVTLFSIVGLAVFNSIITTKFVLGSVPGKTLDTLDDVTGTLCIETGYPYAEQYVASKAPHTPVILRSPKGCLDAVVSGAAQGAHRKRARRPARWPPQCGDRGRRRGGRKRAQAAPTD